MCVQYIEATDLESDMKRDNPVQYHEAWQQLCSSGGVLIPGGFGVRGMEGKILAAEWARKTKKPYLGNNSALLRNYCLLSISCRYNNGNDNNSNNSDSLTLLNL